MVAGPEEFFADPAHPKPLVETVDDRGAATVLDSLGICVPKEVPGAYALNWRSGRRSVVRSVDTSPTTSTTEGATQQK